MKVLYVHNEYARLSGEEHAAGELVALLREHGHEVRWFTRASSEITASLSGKIKAFAAGIYNPFSARELAKVLDDFKPDIVHVQNLYPLLSTSIFTPIRKRGIPVVMRCPNYRLFCPQGLSLDPSGRICERCWGGNESYCVRYNCMGDMAKSIGYALRGAYARLSGDIRRGVNMFIVQSEFQKQKFIGQGIPSEKIGILAGISPRIEVSDAACRGEWVSFVGRVSAEKGIYEFIEAARANRGVPFKVAGNLDSNFIRPADMPDNIEFTGFRKGKDLDEFYINSRIIVVPSKWYEGFPNVIVRGMLHHKPIVTSDVGAMQSIVDHGKNGLLVSPGDSGSLSWAIRDLYGDPARCREFGENGFMKATTLYSRDTIYKELTGIYEQAIVNAENKRN